jgi:hypothetical protein
VSCGGTDHQRTSSLKVSYHTTNQGRKESAKISVYVNPQGHWMKLSDKVNKTGSKTLFMTEALKGNIDSIVDRITTIFFHTSLLLLLMIDVHRLINMRKVAQSILGGN